MRTESPRGGENYPPQFQADALALYESRRGATIASIAADLGLNAATLRTRIRAAGKAAPRAAAPAPTATAPALGAENEALRRKVRELEEERDIPYRPASILRAELRAEPTP
ncbi:transposase [Streptomyces sp. NRRL B-24720]|uniref:transposase n=1 Tax=Streptomyces sp. NRRL B-24720 TaxID=1476876 RepID=UPI002277264C|nr:transposase [Streptomyces sp. NRRL B-24720]